MIFFGCLLSSLITFYVYMWRYPLLFFLFYWRGQFQYFIIAACYVFNFWICDFSECNTGYESVRITESARFLCLQWLPTMTIVCVHMLLWHHLVVLAWLQRWVRWTRWTTYPGCQNRGCKQSKRLVLKRTFCLVF